MLTLSEYLALSSTHGAGPFPPVPTREQVCGVTVCSMNTCPPVTTQQYGTFRMWDLIIWSLVNPADRQACYAAKHALGDTHAMLPYVRDPGVIYYGAYPYNEAADPQFELNPQGFVAALYEYLQNGFTPIICLQSDGPQNTAVAFSQLDTLIPLLQSDPHDLTKYCLVFLCWDSVFYGWTDANDVARFGSKFRRLCPEGYLMVEHNTGHIPLGEGGNDYDCVDWNGDPSAPGRMSSFDVIASEYDYSNDVPPADNIWQINGRLEQPYHRPPDQPVDDDPHPPFYLAPGSPRGPYFHCAFEWEGTYHAIRGESTPDEEAQRRAYMRSMGCKWTG